MITYNAESKAPGTRTDKEECWNSTNSRCSERTGRNSSTFRSESFSSDRDDRSQANPINNPRGIALGGTIEQLIIETRTEITEIASRSEKLHNRLTELENLLHQLQSKSEDLKGVE